MARPESRLSAHLSVYNLQGLSIIFPSHSLAKARHRYSDPRPPYIVLRCARLMSTHYALPC
ncbi:uncharacterized protein SCHCODRAFT_02608184 [Schizophyllum commune H4-8]|uniref:uncharacterized protein n=1 Tax=Schizophyllum commune (strain H4-8 / FGSC 9210) TaxID=578458 RepID=UPI0021603899|nr:uncharacterized protein SCHCODRAFT_02608184 [Schizophyllum commune H4-8]KAI5900544.1 hypothetical protein SCHCODRAFT_02608184 [Schizophyllum commune H4-8]